MVLVTHFPSETWHYAEKESKQARPSGLEPEVRLVSTPRTVPVFYTCMFI